uniref:Membrane protein, palmitoylated 7a (MAGUK p55 subfamily member 7) n=1 Tax=Astyanax mexicanus TaxID=7994 RepID=A0A8B9JEG7_ASTMX
DHLLSVLPVQLQAHVDSADDRSFLHTMFGERSLHSLVKVHEKLQHYEESCPAPVLDTAGALAQGVSIYIPYTLSLLPLSLSLLSVHDTVAQKSYEPELPPLPDDIDDDEDSVKIIRLVKNKEPLVSFSLFFFTILFRADAQSYILGVSRKCFFLFYSASPWFPLQVYLRALFDYNPEEDTAIPCKEAGLAFSRGDVLQVVSQDDATWWQAKHEGGADHRAGLIPSKHFQERGKEHTSFRRSFRLSKRNKKTNKSMYECKKSEQYDTADLPTYEEVAHYRKGHGAKHRLVVLVGPTGVGLNELKRKLLISDPQHFSVTIPHTSRGKRSQESDGVEYHFISKHLFETDIHNNKFIEHGEYKGNYYGTSVDSVRSVLAKNKVCLLDVQPHTLKHLRTAEFKPFVVFVKPPSIERLRETRKNAKIISGKDDKGSAKPFMVRSTTHLMHVFHQPVTPGKVHQCSMFSPLVNNSIAVHTLNAVQCCKTRTGVSR